jgi:hypothetical protein
MARGLRIEEAISSISGAGAVRHRTAEVEYFIDPRFRRSRYAICSSTGFPYLPLLGAGFHASGVEIRGHRGFLGEAGRGKSTLAAAFARRGYRILTDDCLHLSPSAGGYRVRPWSSGIRLWQDSIEAVWGAQVRSQAVAHYTRKQRVAA